MCDTNFHLVPPPLFLEDSILYSEVKDLIIDLPVDARGTADVYIDDIISLTVYAEDSDNVQRLDQATLLTIHCAAQEKHKNEPIPRE